MTETRLRHSGSPWSEIFLGRYGPYTFLLILGMSLYAINQFVVATIMPSIAADLGGVDYRSEEHTSELQSQSNIV